MASQMTNIDRARAQLAYQHMFYAHLMMSTPMVETTDVPLAATDGTRILVNPVTLNQQPVSVIRTIIVHELKHMMYLHVARMRQAAYTRARWNVATDYVINAELIEDGFTLWEGALYNRMYMGMLADDVYRLVPEEPPEEGGGGEGLTRDLRGDLAEGPVPSPMEVVQQMQRMQQRIAQAALTARMMGQLPASIARQVDGILNPPIPWQEILRDYMTRLSDEDETWSRRSRRCQTAYLPSRRSEAQLGEIVIIGDTSGSMVDDVHKGVAEVRVIAETLHPERIRLVWADTEVAGEQVFEEGDDVQCVAQGGGGTDMRVPLAYVERYDPAVVILITDGETPWPTAVPYPLIVLCTSSQSCPLGQVVRV